LKHTKKKLRDLCRVGIHNRKCNSYPLGKTPEIDFRSGGPVRQGAKDKIRVYLGGNLGHNSYNLGENDNAGLETSG